MYIPYAEEENHYIETSLSMKKKKNSWRTALTRTNQKRDFSATALLLIFLRGDSLETKCILPFSIWGKEEYYCIFLLRDFILDLQ